MIIGAGGAGKSTLTRAICGVGGEEQKAVLVCEDCKSGKQVLNEVRYTLFPTGTAIAGSLRNGSDSISRMDALRQVVNLCWINRDVVIVDSLRSTHSFVRWLDEHPLNPAVLFVYLHPALDANLARLRGRRAARGVVEAELPPKTFWNVFAFRRRAQSVWNYAHEHYHRQPVRYLEIREGTPEEAAKRVAAMLQELQNHIYGTAPDLPGQLSEVLATPNSMSLS